MRLATFFLLAMSVLLSACQTTDAKNCSPASKDEAAELVYNRPLKALTRLYGVEPTFKFAREPGSVEVLYGTTYNSRGMGMNHLTGNFQASPDITKKLRKHIKFKKGVLHICK